MKQWLQQQLYTMTILFPTKLQFGVAFKNGYIEYVNWIKLCWRSLQEIHVFQILFSSWKEWQIIFTRFFIEEVRNRCHMVFDSTFKEILQDFPFTFPLLLDVPWQPCHSSLATTRIKRPGCRGRLCTAPVRCRETVVVCFPVWLLTGILIRLLAVLSQQKTARPETHQQNIPVKGREVRWVSN